MLISILVYLNIEWVDFIIHLQYMQNNLIGWKPSDVPPPPLRLAQLVLRRRRSNKTILLEYCAQIA